MTSHNRAVVTTATLLVATGTTAVFADQPAAATVESPKYTVPSIFSILDGSGITATGYLNISWEHLSRDGAFSTLNARSGI
jgi:hypothetical protein